MGRGFHANIIVVIMLVFGLTACVSPRASEPIRTYVLSPDESVWNSEVPPIRKTEFVLVVTTPKAKPGFDTPSMVYVKRPYELNSFALHQWADTPARMLLPVLVQALERSGSWRAVVTVSSPVRGDYRLDFEDLVLEQEFLDTPSRIRLALRGRLTHVGESKVIGSREFELLETVPSDDPYGGVLAANKATAQLLQQIVRWLQLCVTSRQSC